MERKCRECPAFFDVKEEGLIPTAGGWDTKTIDGNRVNLCRPGKTIQKKKPMQQFCYYCLATVKAKKIGHKASWTGRTPTWCPLGREVTEDERKSYLSSQANNCADKEISYQINNNETT